LKIDHRFIFAEAAKHGWRNPSSGRPTSAREAGALFGAVDTQGTDPGDPQPGAGAPEAYHLDRVGEIELDLSTRYLIKGVLPSAGIGVIYGQPGSGKTWATLDMAFSVALGGLWQGHRTRQGAVVVIAAENAHNIRQRARIRLQREGLDPQTPIYVLYGGARMVNLSSNESLALMIERLVAIRPVLVVIDTLATAMVGDENSAQDMSAAIRGIKHIQHALGELESFVLVVHHSGKDESRGARGHSSLLGAVDVEILVKGDSYSVTVEGTKCRGGPLMEPLYLKLSVEEFARDEEGDPIDYVRLVPAPAQEGATTQLAAAFGEPQPANRVQPKGVNQRSLLACFYRMASPRHGVEGVPEGAMGAPLGELISAGAVGLVHVHSTGRNSREARQRQMAEQAVAKLVADGLLLQCGDWVLGA